MQWWALYAEDKPQGRTLTSCMEQVNEDFGKLQWHQDFHMLMYATPDPNPYVQSDGSDISGDGTNDPNQNSYKDI